MYEVNRSVLTLQPKQPFLQWIRSLYDASSLPQLPISGNALLIPAMDDESELPAFLAEHCQPDAGRALGLV